MTSKSVSSLSTFDSFYKDVYAAPGSRMKQWVVEMGREQAWERETCPSVDVPVHSDNCGGECRNVGTTQWHMLSGHDCCYECNDLEDVTAARPDIAAWIAERDARPPITSDRSVLSDEIAPDMGKMGHPLFEAMKRSR